MVSKSQIPVTTIRKIYFGEFVRSKLINVIKAAIEPTRHLSKEKISSFPSKSLEIIIEIKLSRYVSVNPQKIAEKKHNT